jgi:putative ABC transport system permease protein
VNHKLWQERLNGDSNLEGKKLTLNGDPYSVIGVVPGEFKQPFDPEVELWISMSNFPGNTAQRDTRFLFAVGHLRSESSLTQAQAEASTVASQLEKAYPKENAGRGAKVSYLKEVTVSFIRPTLLMLFAAVGVILLIACANLANLLLARSLTRQREIALRAALGASKWRLLRQLLTETTLLGLLGGVGGVVLAYWGMQALLKLPQNFANTGEVRLDFQVLLFALGVSVLTGWLFGLAPAVQLARANLHPTLKEGGRSTGGGAGWNRLRSGSVIVQVALSLILLITGGLLIRSFNRLLQVDVGFQPTNVLTLEYRLPRSKYQQNEAQWNFHHQVIERLSEVPGVKSAALVRGVPFSGNSATTPIILPDREQPAQGKEPQAMFNTATANYFDTMGIPLIKGRFFTEQDRINTQTVFLINETMERRFWPDQDPIGKAIKLVDDTGTTGVVIGVVGDVKQIFLEEAAVPQIYSAYSQTPGIFATAVIRTTIEPMSLAEQVRQAVWKVDSDQPMWKIRTVEFLIDRNKADKQFVVILMSIFASLALILTVIGLYGVIGYTVNQRQQEIGIRMALGAQARNILTMVLRQGMTLVLIGLTLGVIAAWLITRLLEISLFGVSTYDPLTYVGITALLSFVALLACYLPARRATKVDPIVTLKYD